MDRSADPNSLGRILATTMNAWLAKIGFVLISAVAIWLMADSPATLHSQSTLGESNDELSGGLKVVSSMLPSGTQQIIVVEAGGRTMAVYHVEPTQGKIQLKSVRKLAWDLRMEQFNGQAPLPSELKLVQP